MGGSTGVYGLFSTQAQVMLNFHIRSYYRKNCIVQSKNDVQYLYSIL